MGEPRLMLLFICCFVVVRVTDSCVSISPSFSLDLGHDVLLDDTALEDESIVADHMIETTNPAAVESFLKDIEQLPWFNQGFIEQPDSTKGKSKEFVDLDEQMLDAVDKGGKDRSSKQNNWARRKFDAWQKFVKDDIHAPQVDLSIPMEDIPHLELNEMLVRFLLQVRKKDGSLFPAGSLNCLLKAVGRIMRKKQESKMAETGVRVEGFSILRDPLFIRARLAFVASADTSRKAGVGVKEKKAQAIPYNSEKDLLADLDYKIETPRGVQRRLCFYMCSRFAIRGAGELYEVKDVDLSLESDGKSEYVMYNERTSKTWGTSVTKYDPSHFRPAIWSYEEDFVLTYKQYIRHLPTKENAAPRPLFLQPISNYKPGSWFSKGRVGTNNISKWLKEMGAFLDVDICNKSGRVSTVTRMSMAGVPSEIGKLITGHRKTENYEKYDRSKDIQINAAMSVNSKPYNDDGSLRLYSDVLTEMIKLKENSMLGSHSSKCLFAPDSPAPDTPAPGVAGLHHASSSGDHGFPAGSDLYVNASIEDVSVQANQPVIGSANNLPHNAMSSDPVPSRHVNSADVEEKNMLQVSEVEGKDVSKYKGLVDYWMFDEFLKSNQHLHKYFPPNIEVRNVGGHSFVGATFNNCTFVHVPDSNAIVPYMDKGKSIS